MKSGLSDEATKNFLEKLGNYELTYELARKMLYSNKKSSVEAIVHSLSLLSYLKAGRMLRLRKDAAEARTNYSSENATPPHTSQSSVKASKI